MSIASYLSELVSQKNNLAANLVTKGVSASSSETLNTLVPKVLSISGGGGSAVLSPLTVTSNGDYTPGAGIDGFNEVHVSVPGGGGDTIWAGIVDGSLTSINDIGQSVSSIMSFVFSGHTNLETAIFPAAQFIGNCAFQYCSALTTASFPAAVNIKDYAFASCSALTTASFPATESIWTYAFVSCPALTTASFPAAINIGMYAFAYCFSLASAYFPSAVNIGNHAFGYCSSLTKANFPLAESIGTSAFIECRSISTASFPAAANIGNSAFYRCYYLESLYLLGSSVCNLTGSNAFKSTPIGGYSAYTGDFGYIYVPLSLYSSYISASNWSYYSSRFVSI